MTDAEHAKTTIFSTRRWEGNYISLRFYKSFKSFSWQSIELDNCWNDFFDIYYKCASQICINLYDFKIVA